MHRYHTENLARAGALLLGRVTYQLMEDGWREPARTGVLPKGMEPWMQSFATTIDAVKKYVVSGTLERADWNAELVRGDLREAVQRLKNESGGGVHVGGVRLAQSLAEMGLIDEYEFMVHPRLAGHGPTLFAGLSRYVDLALTGRHELASGAVVLRYRPK
jgi:dihydrofolate reductase